MKDKGRLLVMLRALCPVATTPEKTVGGCVNFHVDSISFPPNTRRQGVTGHFVNFTNDII